MSALTISPEDEKRVKGMGFLNNRGTDLFSARVLTTNGKVTAAQHRCMADAAEKFGCGEILYTTRLSVEIPGISEIYIERRPGNRWNRGKGPSCSVLQRNHLSVWTSGFLRNL